MADFLIGGGVDPGTHQRTDATTTIASGDLTTHGVIVGMTGSGKTGLGVVLIEEALRNGVPTLLIDPKGDLTNLCLTFPDLAPTDFEPWVNAGDAANAGATVPEFAAKQATAWREGLAGWSLDGAAIKALRDTTDLTIYTPGSTAGVGLNVVGSLASTAPGANAEDTADEIEGFVSGLLALVDIDADPLASREHILLSNLIANEWSAGRSLDLAGLVGMIPNPPIRKLGVFDLDSFYPAAKRTELAMRLNGLLASPSFAAWMVGAPLDIDAMLRTADGKPRCAIITTAHLSDPERQFATTLVLSTLITWMRRQSGTTDLRAMLYMDEVAGYLPPTAVPPTKKPIMTLMKQARAFGVGVVLSTQNPVDLDYKALSNAGTWMIGRLQTERDKDRLLDGMSAAAGGIDVGAISDTISGLAKREFVLRRAGKDKPEVFTSRWAMSYLRGPLTREQIATLMESRRAAPTSVEPTPPVQPSTSTSTAGSDSGVEPQVTAPSSTTDAAPPSGDSTPVMPEVAGGIAVRWADPAAPWLAAVGADPRGTALSASIVARVSLRYDDTTADLLHDEEYEAVLHPLSEPTDATRAIAVDYDDRDLRTEPLQPATYSLSDAPLRQKAYFTGVERGLVDHLTRSLTLEILANRGLKLFSRPGEPAEDFARRCLAAGDERADAETAKLRDKYETRATRLRDQLRDAHDRTAVLQSAHDGQRNEELLSTAGSILGGLLGGRSRSGMLGSVLGKAAGKRSRTATANSRLSASKNKEASLTDQLEDLEAELTQELLEIDSRWKTVAANVTTMPITLERSDVKVTQLAVVWLPVS